MPADSRYAAVKSDFTKRAKGDDGAPRMPVQKYADGVVSKIVAGSGPKFWYGAGAAFLKVAIAWLPTWLLVGVLPIRLCAMAFSDHTVGQSPCKGHRH
jgi:1-acylglycerone phosphate reductase